MQKLRDSSPPEKGARYFNASSIALCRLKRSLPRRSLNWFKSIALGTLRWAAFLATIRRVCFRCFGDFCFIKDVYCFRNLTVRQGKGHIRVEQGLLKTFGRVMPVLAIPHSSLPSPSSLGNRDSAERLVVGPIRKEHRAEVAVERRALGADLGNDSPLRCTSF